MRKGGMTVFLGMTILLILSLFFSLIEVVHFFGIRENLVMVSDAGAESTFADYNRLLWEDYHILAVDGGYGTGQMDIGNVERRMAAYLDENANPGMDAKESAPGGSISALTADRRARGVNFFRSRVTQCRVEEYGLLTDQSGIPFMKEAANAAIYGMPDALLDEWTDTFETAQGDMAKAPDVGELLSQGDEAVEQAKESGGDGTDEAAAGGGTPERVAVEPTAPTQEPTENPMDTVLEWKSRGVLAQVIPGDVPLSDRTMTTASPVSKRPLQSGTLAARQTLTPTEQILFGLYLKETFQNYLRRDGHQGLVYEWEYVICGKDSDLENLEGVVERLLGLREAENFLSILSDETKVAQALGIATALVGFTANPAIIEAVKYGIMAAWAYVESVLDVRLLLTGGKVALVKTAAEWTSQIAALASYLDPHVKANACGHGLDYEGYLMALTTLTSNALLGLRGLDLLEDALHASEDYYNVRMDQMIYEAKFSFAYETAPIFLSAVPLFGKEAGMYEIFREKEMTYL